MAEPIHIAMYADLFELAQQVGVDMERFADDFDHGITKYQVLQEAQEGWQRGAGVERPVMNV